MERFLEDLSRGRITPRTLITQPDWLNFPSDVRHAERNLPIGSTVVLLTADAYNDTQRPGIMRMVSENVKKRINYIYVIPFDCVHKQELIRLVTSMKSDYQPEKK